MAVTKQEEAIHVFEKRLHKSQKLKTAPAAPEGNQTYILEGLYKFSKKHFNKARYFYKEGKYLKSAEHLAISLWAVEFGVSYLVTSLFPKEFLKNR